VAEDHPGVRYRNLQRARQAQKNRLAAA
jgi:hypothetical protein